MGCQKFIFSLRCFHLTHFTVFTGPQVSWGQPWFRFTVPQAVWFWGKVITPVMYYCLLEEQRMSGAAEVGYPNNCRLSLHCSTENAGWAGQALASLITSPHISTKHTQVLKDLVVVIVIVMVRGVVVTSMYHYKKLFMEVQATTAAREWTGQREFSYNVHKLHWIWGREIRLSGCCGGGVAVGKNKSSLQSLVSLVTSFHLKFDASLLSEVESALRWVLRGVVKCARAIWLTPALQGMDPVVILR